MVARIEAFISGLGLDEALHRAHAYSNAGADAILVHSKKNNPEDIVEFMDNYLKNAFIFIQLSWENISLPILENIYI